MKKLSILKLLSILVTFVVLFDFTISADGKKYKPLYRKYKTSHGPVVVGLGRYPHKKAHKMRHKKYHKKAHKMRHKKYHKKAHKMRHKKITKGGVKAKGKHTRSRILLGRKGEEPKKYRPSHKRYKRSLAGKKRQSKIYRIKKHRKGYSARIKK